MTDPELQVHGISGLRSVLPLIVDPSLARHGARRRRTCRRPEHRPASPTPVPAQRHSQGRAYFDKKLAQGKTRKEALRALKRQVSDAVFTCLKADARRARVQVRDPEGSRGTTLQPARPLGIAGTFLLSVGGRRPELALLHKTGAARRQIAWISAAESLVLTLTGIILSAVVSGLVLGGLYAALTSEVGSASVTLPWPLVGATLAGCVVIAILTSTLPVWFQLRPRRRPYGSPQG